MIDDRTPEQVNALAELDTAIRNAWQAFGRSEPDPGSDDPGWSHTSAEDRMVTEWVVCLGVMGNDEGQVDMLMPAFPALPHHHAVGVLTDALDQLRSEPA